MGIRPLGGTKVPGLARSSVGKFAMETGLGGKVITSKVQWDEKPRDLI